LCLSFVCVATVVTRVHPPTGLFLAVSILDNSGYQVTVTVFDVANRQWRDDNAFIFALPVGQPPFVGHLCPMGQFLVAGTDTVVLQSWNDTAEAYDPSYVFGEQGAGYYFATAVGGAVMFLVVVESSR
jgi:hypothetical protein